MANGKTEKPTPQRLLQLRKKGQVPLSREVDAAAITVGFSVVFFTSLPILTDRLKAVVLLPIPFLQEEQILAIAPELIQLYIREILGLTAPFLGVILFMGMGAHLVQTGALFSLEAATPSLGRLNPSANIARVFSLHSLTALSKSIIKVLVLGLVLFYVLYSSVGDLVWIPSCGISCLGSATRELLRQIAAYVSSTYVVLAMADFAFERWQFLRRSMMSLDEVKRDHREAEGSPLIKNQRRKVHAELTAVAQSRRATVLIANPTHIAVAMYYDRQQTPLPVIDAIGTDLIAQLMIDAAGTAGVPVIHNIPLARALFDDGLVNEYIPSHLIEPVAAVLRALSKLES